MLRTDLALAAVLSLVSVFSISSSAFCFDSFDDEEDDTEARRERLVQLIESTLAEGRANPSVLGDLDPREAAAYDAKVARSLRRERVSVEFSDTPVADVFDLLREATGSTFVLTGRAKEFFRDSKTLVSLRVRRMTVESLLNRLTKRWKLIRFQVRDGAVVVQHRSEYRARRTLRVYDIRDIVRPRRHFKAPRLGLPGQKGRD